MKSGLAEWVRLYGRIPEDATHFSFYDTGTSIDTFDVKKLEEGKVYAWSEDSDWRLSLRSIDDLNDPSKCMPLTRLDMWEATFGEVPDGATHLYTGGAYLSTCDIKKLDNNGRLLFWGAGSKNWVASDFDAQKLADESLFQCLTPPDHATAKVEEWIAAYGPLPPDATHIFSHGCLDICLHKTVDGTSYFWSKSHGWEESSVNPTSRMLLKIPEKYQAPEAFVHNQWAALETLEKLVQKGIIDMSLLPASWVQNRKIETRIMGAVIDWVSEFGDLPDGATHLSRRLMYGPHMSDAVYRLSGSACHYWDFRAKSWLTPVLCPNESALVRIPEAGTFDHASARRTVESFRQAYPKLVGNTAAFPVAAMSDQSFPYHLGGNYGG